MVNLQKRLDYVKTQSYSLHTLWSIFFIVKTQFNKNYRASDILCLRLSLVQHGLYFAELLKDYMYIHTSQIIYTWLLYNTTGMLFLKWCNFSE